MSQSIAKRYATALFELADESYQLKKVVMDVDLIHQCFLDSEDFRNFIKHPALPFEARVSALKAIFGKKIEEITLEFLKLLAQKERLEFIDLVAVEFKSLAQEAEGVVVADVVAADEISSAQSKEMTAYLKKRLDKDIELNISVDQSMLGGFKIKVEDQVFDYSLDYQLESFKKKVLKG